MAKSAPINPSEIKAFVEAGSFLSEDGSPYSMRDVATDPSLMREAWKAVLASKSPGDANVASGERKERESRTCTLLLLAFDGAELQRIEVPYQSRNDRQEAHDTLTAMSAFHDGSAVLVTVPTKDGVEIVGGSLEDLLSLIQR